MYSSLLFLKAQLTDAETWKREHIWLKIIQKSKLLKVQYWQLSVIIFLKELADISIVTAVSLTFNSDANIFLEVLSENLFFTPVSLRFDNDANIFLKEMKFKF